MAVSIRSQFVVLIFATIASACSLSDHSIAQGRPNIVWITAEDISPAFGVYGDKYAKTPVVDSFAKESVVFTKAYAVSPICSPSRATLVTGMYATSLGLQHLRSETPMPTELKVLPTLMSESGYFTSISGKTDYNFDPTGLWEYWASDMAPWRKRKSDQPFLSVFTLNNTHEGKGNTYERYLEEVADLPDHLRQAPASVPVPPYYPDTEEAHALWTRYYELVSSFDRKVGEIIQNLKDDGLLENTIVFIFSDHGFGMPRYKRWLNDTGLRVPLIVHVPDRYKYLIGHNKGSLTDQLVSFVDFAPTVLALAGIKVPDYMQGSPFMGPTYDQYNREDFYAFRSRADNMYDMSRGVHNGEYLYVRHFMPHLPYIQKSKIMSADKDSYRMLQRMYLSGVLSDESLKMFGKKPIEELYKLTDDPHELVNLADDPAYESIKGKLASRLKQYALETSDLGFLYESEMVIRAKSKPPYYLRNNKRLFDLPSIFDAAWQVGTNNVGAVRQLLDDNRSEIQFWGIMAAHQLPLEQRATLFQAIYNLYQATDITNQIAAAELLYQMSPNNDYLELMVKHLGHPVNEVVLQAARALEMCLPEDPEIINDIEAVLARLRAPEGSTFPYKDYNFASFVSWSLEEVVDNYYKKNASKS